MAQTLTFNDADVEVQIDTSTGTNDLRITGEEGQRVVTAIRELKKQLPDLRKVLWDAPGGGIVGRLRVWADGTPRIVYLNFSDLTQPSPNFYYEFFNGSWTDAELGYLDKLKDAFLDFNTTHTLTSSLGLSTPDPADIVPWGNLLAYWPLNESPSGTRYDSYAAYHLSEFTPPMLAAAGKNGNGAYSDGGVNDRLENLTNDFRPSSRFLTISAWFYVGTTPGGSTSLLVSASNPGTADWYLRVDNTGTDNVRAVLNTSAGPVSSEAVISLSQWHHVLAEIDTTVLDETVLLYLDNVASTTGTAVPAATPTVTSTYIRLLDSNGGAGDITLDEVAIFNGQLTVDQRAALYNSGVGRFF